MTPNGPKKASVPQPEAINRRADIQTGIICGTWPRGGSLVESVDQRVVGPNLALVPNSQLPVALRRETPTQYPYCIGSASD